jgi:hypothetical protein
MKKITLLSKSIILLMLVGVFSFSSFSVNIKTGNHSGVSGLQTLGQSALQLHLVNRVGSVKTVTVHTENGDFTRLLVKNYAKNLGLGYPELPVKRTLIELPLGAQPKIRIISYDLKEYSLDDFGVSNLLIPVQPPQPKCGGDPPFEYNPEQYQIDDFTNDELVSVEVLGMMRSQRIARLDISPVQYNPVKNSIRVYENLEFEITFENADLQQTQIFKQTYYSPYFNEGFQAVVNYSIPLSSRDNMTQYPVKYVIISDRMFENKLQPFIEWKIRKGFTIVEAYTDVIGFTKEEIKDYIQGLYDAGTPDDPAPSFVLFVGDIEEIPVWNNGNGVTDRNYVEYTGDLFPEIFYGRFSAEDTSQLQPYIDKTLQYEQFTMPSADFLDTVVMIAGMDGSHGYDWGNGQINYGTINYFNDDHDIFSHTYLYPESGSHSTDIIQNISDGVCFANYTAHCGPSGWADPSFSISDIPGLQNQDKYGLLIGNCCSSSEFQQDCFAEEMLRAENKGAVGYIGGSNSTYWDEDYYFGVGVGTISENPPSYEETTLGNYDRSFHDHGELFGEWYTTQDQAVYAGNMAVTTGAPGSAAYYWDIYNLMGDPSLMVYFSNPPEMTVSCPSVILLGQTLVEVDAEPYAYVAISMDNVLHGVCLADSLGHADVIIEAFTTPGDADIVITAQNFQPYIETISVIPADGPYVIYNSHLVNDADGNNNGQIDYHESILLDVGMENVGNEDAENVQVVLSTDNPYIVITDSTEDYGSIPAGDTINIADAFAFDVADSVPNNSPIQFTLKAIEIGGDTFVSKFHETAHAPEIFLQSFVVNDDVLGNGNGKLEPGETADIGIYLTNGGSATALNIDADLFPGNDYLIINSEQQHYGDVHPDSTGLQWFNVTASMDTPGGTTVPVIIDWSGDYGFFGSGFFKIVIGQVPVLILNLTDSDVSPEAMQECFEELTVGSEIGTTLPAAPEIYKSIFVCLGIYPNNHELTNDEGQILADFLDTGGRVYMEGGDTWAYDEATPVHPYFSIDGTDDGTDDLHTVTGVDGSFAGGFAFTYNGENGYIDHLVPTETAISLFTNLSSEYDIGIANETETYKTIGTSFEFGGLLDGGHGTKDGIMAEILRFFDIYFVWTDEAEHNAEASCMNIYPNPASGRITVQLQLLSSQKVSLIVFDLTGREVLRSSENVLQRKGVSHLQMDVSGLMPGVYTLIANTSEGRFVRKFVVAD